MPKPRHFLGFEHHGMQITNPTASECGGRFTVSPAHYGFEIEDTGGGCTAWCKRLPDGTHILLTNFDASHELPTPGEPFQLGLYDQDDTQEGIWTYAVGVAYDDEDAPENEARP